MPMTPVTIGRSCEVGRAVRLTANWDMAAETATIAAMITLWPAIAKLCGESFSANRIEQSTSTPPTIDDSADTARPFKSSDRASACRACSRALLSRTTKTPLTPMSAMPPTADRAVRPSHVPYPTSPR